MNSNYDHAAYLYEKIRLAHTGHEIEFSEVDLHIAGWLLIQVDLAKSLTVENYNLLEEKKNA